jgi:hypothetical protein
LKSTFRAGTLLLEATLFTKGMNGVSDLARKWGKKQPRGYLYYIQNLIKEKDWVSTAKACTTAKYLVQAGKNLKNKAFLLKGKQEKFISSPDETNLLDLMDEANQQRVREKELDNLIKLYRKTKVSSFREDTLYTKLLLMGGELKTTYDDIKSEKCRVVLWQGWSRFW